MDESNPKIFINYRSGDQGLAALLLDRELSHRFGADQVFLDTRSLVAGKVFDTRLLTAVRGCAVLIAVIGRNWLTLTDEHGRRLIDRRRDWVRTEIAEGLARGVPVIPVLVDDVAPLIGASLPPSIRALARHQFVPLRPRSFRSDLEHLIIQLRALNPVFDQCDRETA
jgi:TIR domain-containing protein